MIINTGQRTDIPAFYSRWFFGRIKEGFVMARNPFDYHRITRYRLDPCVVDLIAFCTKNPAPMLKRLPEISHFRQIWHVSVTPYGKDIEPFVPPADEVISSMKTLSRLVGVPRLSWRYDPIFLNEKYTGDFHLRAFAHMAEELEGVTETCIISFIDLYQKTMRNFPRVRRVSHEAQYRLAAKMVEIGKDHGMQVVSCLEDPGLEAVGVDVGGCFTKEKIEKALGIRLRIPSRKSVETRKGCRCLLGHDIGAYNSCFHFCRYCYANQNERAVRENCLRHDPHSPLLLGHVEKDDIVTEAKQESWIDPRTSLF